MKAYPMNKLSPVITFTCGALLASIAILMTGATSEQPKAPNTSLGSVGRFSIASSGDGYAFILDTITGEVWQNRGPADNPNASNFNRPKVR
jgi:hypothetical protein